MSKDTLFFLDHNHCLGPVWCWNATAGEMNAPGTPFPSLWRMKVLLQGTSRLAVRLKSTPRCKTVSSRCDITWSMGWMTTSPCSSFTWEALVQWRQLLPLELIGPFADRLSVTVATTWDFDHFSRRKVYLVQFQACHASLGPSALGVFSEVTHMAGSTVEGAVYFLVTQKQRQGSNIL